MTATSAVIDDPATGDPARWRTRWCRRENDRRRHAYDRATSAWQRHHDHLTRLRIEAAGYQGYLSSGAGLPVRLADHEMVYRVVPDVRLVEVPARHAAGLPAPGVTTGVRPTAGGRGAPKGLRAVDHGTLLVTDQRVVFAGSGGEREWRYTDVTGVAHHRATPLSLLHSTGGLRLAGLLAPPTAVTNFRFYLTLAFAAATARRADVVADIEASLAAHETARPVPPPPVRPADAPLTARRPERRTSVVAALVVVAAVWITGVLGAASTDPPYRAEAGTSTPAATDPPRPAGGTSPGPQPVTSTATPPLPGAPRAAARPDATRPATGAPPPRPSASAKDAPAATKEQTRRTRPTVRPAPSRDRAPATSPPPTTVAPSGTPSPTGSALLTTCLGAPLPLVDPLLCVRL